MKDVLARRWKTLISVPPAQRASLFRETGFRKVTGQYPHLEPGKPKLSPIAKLTADDPLPHITRYGFRSLDRQWIIADTRVGDRIREPLWRAHSNRQIYLTSLLTGVIGEGPALVACSDVPDLHHFRGSFGGKDAIPLWRDRGATQANILPGLLAQLQACYKAPVNAEDFVGYCYAVVAHPAYTSRFAAELEHRQPRVPLTQDTELFKEAVSIGRRLLWLHTYGQRFAPQGTQPGDLPAGKAQWTKPVSLSPARYPESYTYDQKRKLLIIGDGEAAPVEPSVWEFQVSGLRVVSSWLDYRMRRPGGKHSSALEDIQPERWPAAYSSELLSLLWILEATLAEYPRQAKLLDKILSGPLLLADDLPAVPDDARRPPDVSGSKDQPSLL